MRLAVECPPHQLDGEAITEAQLPAHQVHIPDRLCQPMGLHQITLIKLCRQDEPTHSTRVPRQRHPLAFNLVTENCLGSARSKLVAGNPVARRKHSRYSGHSLRRCWTNWRRTRKKPVPRIHLKNIASCRSIIRRSEKGAQSARYEQGKARPRAIELLIRAACVNRIRTEATSNHAA
jgi:hypothetical protein